MGREKNRRAVVSEKTKKIFESSCSLRIHSNHWFVDDEDARLVNQSSADDQTLLHAVRITFHQLVFPLSQFEAIQEFGNPALQPRCLDMVKLADKVQKFAAA